jgi:hypothetical protein
LPRANCTEHLLEKNALVATVLIDDPTAVRGGPR